MNRIWLLTILSLGLIIIFGNWESLFGEKEVLVDEPNVGLERPDYSLEELLLRDFAEDGRLNHQISAQRIDHYASDDHLEVQLPLLSTYTEGKLFMEARSDSAVVHQNPSVVIMQGQTSLAQKQPPFLSLATRNLFIYPDNGVAESQHKTRIQTSNIVLNSGAFLYRYNQGQLELSQGVDGTINSDNGGQSQLQGQSLVFRYQGQTAQSLVIKGQPAEVQYQHPQQSMLGSANKIQYDFQNQVLILEGNAQLQQGGQSFSGETLRFDIKQNRVITGNVGEQQPPVKFIIQQPEKKSNP